jgi:hypothetical protein
MDPLPAELSLPHVDEHLGNDPLLVPLDRTDALALRGQEPHRLGLEVGRARAPVLRLARLKPNRAGL